MPRLGTVTDPSQQQITERENTAISELHSEAVQDISAIGSEDDVHVRDLLPEEDLESGADNGWNGTNRVWLQSGLSVDSLNETYTVDSDSKAQNKIVRVYGVANVSDDPITTEIEFLNNTGSPVERAQIQTTEVADVSDIVLFERDIQFGADQDGSVEQWSTADASDDRLILLGKVAEQSDSTIAERGKGR